MSGKSAISLATCEEKNQPIPKITMNNKSTARLIESTSGNFLFLKKRYTGSNTMLIKNAISKGIIILWPSTIKRPINTNPRSSIDLLTVTGMSFMKSFDVYEMVKYKCF